MLSARWFHILLTSGRRKWMYEHKNDHVKFRMAYFALNIMVVFTTSFDAFMCVVGR
jgi:hypothetical protein